MFSCLTKVQPQMSPKCTGITFILHPTSDRRWRPSRTFPLTWCNLVETGSVGSWRASRRLGVEMMSRVLVGGGDKRMIDRSGASAAIHRGQEKQLKINYWALKITRNDYPQKRHCCTAEEAICGCISCNRCRKAASRFFKTKAEVQVKKTCNGNYRERCFGWEKSMHFKQRPIFSFWMALYVIPCECLETKPRLVSLLSHWMASLEVFSWLILWFGRGEVVLQKALEILKGRPLFGLLAPTGEHEIMQGFRAFGGTGHPVPTLYLIQNLPVHHAWIGDSAFSGQLSQ